MGGIVKDEDDDDETIDESVIRNEDAKNPWIQKYATDDIRKEWETMETKRKEKSRYIQQNFGSFCNDKKSKKCFNCVNRDENSKGFNDEFLQVCDSAGHHYDNLTNWIIIGVPSVKMPT